MDRLRGIAVERMKVLTVNDPEEWMEVLDWLDTSFRIATNWPLDDYRIILTGPTAWRKSNWRGSTVWKVVETGTPAVGLPKNGPR
jgi:hypothetical protein